MEELGLRERKKRRTREAITEAAFALFEESGFDAVSVADVAAAAEVSKPTLFAYFPTKEDLVLHRFFDGSNGPALVVGSRPAGTPALKALRQDFVDRLATRDPLTGLNDTAPAVTFHNLLYSTPAVMARLAEYILDQERALAGELVASGGIEDEFTASLVAAEVFGAQRILSSHNAQQIREGHSAEAIFPAAVKNAEFAYGLLENGINAQGSTT